MPFQKEMFLCQCFKKESDQKRKTNSFSDDTDDDDSPYQSDEDFIPEDNVKKKVSQKSNKVASGSRNDVVGAMLKLGQNVARSRIQNKTIQKARKKFLWELANPPNWKQLKKH